MDVNDQKLFNTLHRVCIFLFGIGGLIAGHVLQSFDVFLFTSLFGLALTVLLALPFWPFYGRKNIIWLKDIRPTPGEQKKKPKKSK